MKVYLERQIKSSFVASQAKGQEIQRSLDYNKKTGDYMLLEITTWPDDPISLIFLKLQYTTQILYKIDKLYCRKFLSIGYTLDLEKWLTFVWRDLFKGYFNLVKMSKEEFDKQLLIPSIVGTICTVAIYKYTYII